MKRCLGCETTFTAGNWDCPKCGFTPVRINGFYAFAPELAEENDGFDPGSHAALNVLQEHNFWFRARNRLISSLLTRHFPKARRILEVGCGTGFVLTALRKAIPNAEITGSEIYASGLEHASRRLEGRGSVLQMDARRIPYTEEFDVVCAFDVLEHISEDELALREIVRSVKPGGGVLLSVPQHPFLWSRIDDYSHHKRRYRVGELKAKCVKAGLRIERHTSFVSSLLPLMAFQRLQSRSKSEIDPTAELRISRPVNNALELALDIERLMIDFGVSLPVGGSRFVVARKA